MRPRRSGRRQPPAFPGDFPDSDRDITKTLAAVQPAGWDGTTVAVPAGPAVVRFEGASGAGLPDGGVLHVAIARATVEAGPPRYRPGHRPAPGSFPALQAAPESRDILAPVEITEPPKIGDYLRLPVVWCEMPRCISWRLDRESLGERDARHRAITAGWRHDALGRLTCPPCQQADPAYRTPQPVAWYHPEVRRRWHSGERVSEQDAFRLGVEAELGRRISRQNPVLARAIAGATNRHGRTAAAS